MCECKLEVLMSVMHQSDFSLAYKSNIQSDLLIINQCDRDGYDEIEENGCLWRMISTTERGLSKSRNMAINNARGDICLLCDDDETFFDGYKEGILSAYKEIGDADSVVFNINRINYAMKKTYYKISSIRRVPKYRGYGSPMLSFRLNKILENNILMNTTFGSGSQWGGGEEILFEQEIQEKGLKMYEHPYTIATIDYASGASWFNGYDEKYFYNLGAFIGFQFKNKFVLRKLRMLLTCYRLRREKTLSFIQKMKWMRIGMRQFKKGLPYAEYKKGSNK